MVVIGCRADDMDAAFRSPRKYKDQALYMSSASCKHRSQLPGGLQHLANMASTFSMAVFARYSALLAAFVASSNAALSSTGFTVSLDDVPYYIAPNAIATINITKGFPSGSKSGFFTPITVINTDDVDFSGAIFDSVVSNWTETDDVFQSGFLQGG